MATPANRELLQAAGSGGGRIAPVRTTCSIVVKAESEAAAAEALSRVDALLKVRAALEVPSEFRPRSLASALKQLPEARWVLISVPGPRMPPAVAEEALDSGRNVFLYSDNVPLADEVALKRKARGARSAGDGTRLRHGGLNGAGLGFANRVRRGGRSAWWRLGHGSPGRHEPHPRLGSGISQAIGTGGRDLSAEVGGITASQALDLLGRDPETQVIVLVSKPPAPAVAARLLSLAQRCREAGRGGLPRRAAPGRRLGNLLLCGQPERGGRDGGAS